MTQEQTILNELRNAGTTGRSSYALSNATNFAPLPSVRRAIGQLRASGWNIDFSRRDGYRLAK